MTAYLKPFCTLIFLVSVIQSAPALAQTNPNPLGGLLNGVLGQPAVKPPAPAATPASRPAAAPSNLSGTSAKPVAPAGPIALVEDVSGVKGIEVMDSVNDGQTLTLGTGKLVLSFTDGCLTEHIQGGTVTVHAGGSTVTGGKLQTDKLTDCAGPHAVVTADARESGGTVSRITPFEGQAWRDVAIKGARPLFAWPGHIPGEVTVSAIDAPRAVIVWSGKSAVGHLDYPANAPALMAGPRYLVEVTTDTQAHLAAIFAIDPGLDVEGGLAGRLVRIDQPDAGRAAISAALVPSKAP